MKPLIFTSTSVHISLVITLCAWKVFTCLAASFGTKNCLKENFSKCTASKCFEQHVMGKGFVVLYYPGFHFFKRQGGESKLTVCLVLSHLCVQPKLLSYFQYSEPFSSFISLGGTTKEVEPAFWDYKNSSISVLFSRWHKCGSKEFCSFCRCFTKSSKKKLSCLRLVVE